MPYYKLFLMINSHFEITSRPVVSCGHDGSSWYCISVYVIFLSQYNHCKAIEQFLLFLLQIKLICIILLGWDWIFSWDVRCEAGPLRQKWSNVSCCYSILFSDTSHPRLKLKLLVAAFIVPWTLIRGCQCQLLSLVHNSIWGHVPS